MIGIHDLPLFVAAGLMLNLTPGPDMAYIVGRSATGGFRDGAAAVPGITSGCCVHTLAASAAPASRPANIFRESLLINVFNPKVALFLLAFVPQFIDRDAPAKALALVARGALFDFDGLFVNRLVAWLASRTARRARAGADAMRWLRRATGGLFVVLAARLAVAARD